MSWTAIDHANPTCNRAVPGFESRRRLGPYATDGLWLRRGLLLGLLFDSFVGGLAAEAAVGAVVVVVVLPFLELVVEDLGVVDDDAVEEAVELFGIDAVGASKRGVRRVVPRRAGVR